MDEYISREEVINITTETGAWETQNRVRELPAADVQLVKHGKWDGYLCSECNVYADYFISGYDFDFDEKPNFCPNCGARMDG